MEEALDLSSDRILNEGIDVYIYIYIYIYMATLLSARYMKMFEV